MLDGMRGATLLAAHDQAQRVWEGVRLDVERFRQHLQNLGWEDELPPGATEIYLACACAHGDAAGCRYLERDYFDQVRASAARLCRSASSTDEVVQRVRHKLLVGPPPGLLKYTGRGPLQAWLRSVTRRTALDALRSLKHESSEEPSDLRATHGSSIESRIDRGRFLQAFEGSLARVFAQLPARDRNLLRMHYAAGIGIDALGRAYGVHRATAARWIAKVRQDVFAAVKAELTDASGSGLSASEFEDVVRLMRGQLDLALSHWDAESRASMLGLCADDIDAASAGNDG
jgi:RNA polymerase sigma-70 factor (ECF subfamily)